MTDPYAILGVARDAPAAAIKSAYRKLAKKLHPDLNPGDSAAEVEFKNVTAAYDLLGDADKRARYDAGEIDETGAERPPRQYYRDYAGEDPGSAGWGGFGGEDDYVRRAGRSAFGDFADEDDILAELLRRNSKAQANRRGRDSHYGLEVSLADSIAGSTRRLDMPGGEVLDVKIPAGIVTGKIIRLKGKGEPGRGTGGAGDALIEVSILPDPRFTYDGDDLSIEVPISLSEAVAGGKIEVPTPTGRVAMTIPAGATGTGRMRLKGQGVPRREGGRGDLYALPRIVLPRQADPELADFVERWQAGRSFNPRSDSA
ncbi:MAG: DnaJ domain-containing protein [Proteobacteria bacterium]|nr:DnaJ domain-containing protein [Pseudomonadota bacterium]